MHKEYRVKTTIALKKAQSLLSTIQRMIDDDRYCLDLAQQVNAVIGLLKNANATILENHLQTCGTQKLSSENPVEKTEYIKELVQMFAVSNRK